MALFLCIEAFDVVKVKTNHKVLSDYTSAKHPRPQLGLFVRTSNPGDVYVMDEGTPGLLPINIVRLGREFKEKV